MEDSEFYVAGARFIQPLREYFPESRGMCLSLITHALSLRGHLETVIKCYPHHPVPHLNSFSHHLKI